MIIRTMAMPCLRSLRRVGQDRSETQLPADPEGVWHLLVITMWMITVFCAGVEFDGNIFGDNVNVMYTKG